METIQQNFVWIEPMVVDTNPLPVLIGDQRLIQCDAHQEVAFVLSIANGIITTRSWVRDEIEGGTQLFKRYYTAKSLARRSLVYLGNVIVEKNYER